MDPLHKVDSAISVASKDSGVLVEDCPISNQPPSHPASSLTESRRAATTASESRQEAAPTPVSPASQAQPAAMENLVPPLDVTTRSPLPPFVDQPGSDWYQTQLRPPTPPTYAVDPDASPSSPSAYIFTAGGGQASASPAPDDAVDELGVDALTQAGTGAIAVDHDQLELESDLGYESDRASFASTSLSSSVRDYLFENGRRYHRFREGRYNFPNDEAEQDREDMKHACVKMLCQNQLYFAPFDERNLHNVLDIGTGTGIWAIEFGDLFPSANVQGIDLSPIQPDWVPGNVHFVVDDAESEWIHPPDHFDYIHTRHTVMAIKDWPKLYRTAKE